MSREGSKAFTRRNLLKSSMAFGLTACIKKPIFCEEPAIEQDGAFRTASECTPTASNIEGPFYVTDSPERSDFRLWNEEGVEVTLSGRVVTGDCSTPLEGAIVEFWHASPTGEYDNTSSEMRYRGAIQVDSDGAYQLETLLPGRYLNGTQYRPHHIHVKIWNSDGVEVLTTQLYFKGDEYLECDGFANRSLVMSFEGALSTEIVATDIDFIV